MDIKLPSGYVSQVHHIDLKGFQEISKRSQQTKVLLGFGLYQPPGILGIRGLEDPLEAVIAQQAFASVCWPITLGENQRIVSIHILFKTVLVYPFSAVQAQASPCTLKSVDFHLEHLRPPHSSFQEKQDSF